MSYLFMSSLLSLVKEWSNVLDIYFLGVFLDTILPLLLTNLKTLVLIGYVASLLNSYYLYLVLETFYLERITDTAGHKIPLSYRGYLLQLLGG